MNRRDFIKGLIATGALALSPVRPPLSPEAVLTYFGGERITGIYQFCGSRYIFTPNAVYELVIDTP